MTTLISKQTQMTLAKCEGLFYGIAAEIAQVWRRIFETVSRGEYEAILQTMRSVSGIPNAQTLPTEVIEDLNPILAELESSMIQEFFNSPFVYKSLDGPKDICVLILHAGTPSEPLRATIRHDPITRASYEAISYTWGDDSRPCSILVDGCLISITRYLFNALVNIRWRHEDRKLWADSICIHQADNKEKSAQVALMPEIYAQASRLLGYLGVQADGSELIPGLLEKL